MEESGRRAYANDIVSVEPHTVGIVPAEVKGIDRVRGKNDWWEKNMEVHDSKVSGPFVAGDTFVVRFDVDATDKNSKERMHTSEVGIYTVKDDKVVREKFLPLVE